MKSLGVIPRSSASGIGSYSSPNSKAYGDCHGGQVAGGLTELKLHISHGETI